MLEPSGLRRKPFLIQIDTLMDQAHAVQMTTRLQKLGYPAFMVPNDFAGEILWRVRVGPYSSREVASMADEELREKYRDTYAP